MRWAVISDIHADAASLRLVLKDAGKAGAKRIICLGDTVGYGPQPAEAVALVRKSADVCLMGNHDAAVSSIRGTHDFQRIAALAAKKHSSMLGADDIAWLSDLPYLHVEKNEAGETAFACVHGEFLSPAAFNYIIEPRDAMPSFAVRGERLMFVGHTHDPGVFVLDAGGTPVRKPPRSFRLQDGCRYIVNPGSTGYPRHGECASSYCIYDDSLQTVEFRTLPFDMEDYCGRMDRADMVKARWLGYALEEQKEAKTAAKAAAAARKRRILTAVLAAAALAASAAALCVAVQRLMDRSAGAVEDEAAVETPSAQAEENSGLQEEDTEDGQSGGGIDDGGIDDGAGEAQTPAPGDEATAEPSAPEADAPAGRRSIGSARNYMTPPQRKGPPRSRRRKPAKGVKPRRGSRKTGS